MNVCVTNMDAVEAGGRDIGDMFRVRVGHREGQKEEWGGGGADGDDDGEVKEVEEEEEGEEEEWDHDDSQQEEDAERCRLCDRLVPRFAVLAHERFHSLEE